MRKPLPEQIEGDGLDPEEAAHGEIEVTSFPLDLRPQAPPRAAPADRARRRRARRVDGDRLQGARHLGQRPAARGGAGDLGRHVGRDGRRRAAARRRPVLRRPGRPDEPHQGPARLVAAVLARRGDPAHDDLPRLPRRCSRACATCAASSSTTAPSTRRSPATRRGSPLTPENAQRFSRLHPRCGTSFLLIVMIVAIFLFAPIGLPRLVLARPVAHPRRAAHRRHLVRDHQVRRAQPPQALGARGHVARAAAAEADHARAGPRRSSPSRSPPWRRCSRWRRPASTPPRSSSASRSSPSRSATLGAGTLDRVIEGLVDQIEARFAELSQARCRTPR